MLFRMIWKFPPCGFSVLIYYGALNKLSSTEMPVDKPAPEAKTEISEPAAAPDKAKKEGEKVL